MSSEEDEGYALLAAIAAIAVFSTLALALLAQVQAAILQANGEIERARADSAADAGIELAIQNLAANDPALRWSLDGSRREISFAGSRVTIRVVDERSKLPLGALDEAQVRKLFKLLKVPEDRLDIVTDSYLDWTDEDDDPRPNGAESAYYARQHIRPPNTLPQSLDELVMVRGFDADLVKRLKEVATLHFGNGSFNPNHANPIAREVLASGGEDSLEAIEAGREAAGQRTAIDLDQANIAGRTVELQVEAASSGGGLSYKREVVEFTGSRARPYVVVEAD